MVKGSFAFLIGLYHEIGYISAFSEGEYGKNTMQQEVKEQV